MITVYAKVLGGLNVQTFQLQQGATVGELRSQMGLGEGYAAQDGSKEPIQSNALLENDDFIVFSAAVKGGQA